MDHLFGAARMTPLPARVRPTRGSLHRAGSCGMRRTAAGPYSCSDGAALHQEAYTAVQLQQGRPPTAAAEEAAHSCPQPPTAAHSCPQPPTAALSRPQPPYSCSGRTHQQPFLIGPSGSLSTAPGTKEMTCEEEWTRGTKEMMTREA